MLKRRHDGRPKFLIFCKNCPQKVATTVFGPRCLLEASKSLPRASQESPRSGPGPSRASLSKRFGQPLTPTCDRNWNAALTAALACSACSVMLLSGWALVSVSRGGISGAGAELAQYLFKTCFVLYVLLPLFFLSINANINSYMRMVNNKVHSFSYLENCF